VDGKPVETQRFRVEEQGQKVLEIEMYKGVLIDETTVVSSFTELTNIFEETFVNQFSRRIEGDTFDSAEREAWEAELKHITASQFGQSTFTADQIRNNTQNRARRANMHANLHVESIIFTPMVLVSRHHFSSRLLGSSPTKGLMTLMHFDQSKVHPPYTCTSTAFLPPPEATALPADSGPQPKPKLPMTVMQQTRR